MSSKQETRTNGVVTGEYSYLDANGILQTVKYIADENGFRVQATNLPVAPAPTPVAPEPAPVPAPAPYPPAPEPVPAPVPAPAPYPPAPKPEPVPVPAPEPEPVPYPPATEAPEYDDEEYDFNLDLRQGAPELPELS